MKALILSSRKVCFSFGSGKIELKLDRVDATGTLDAIACSENSFQNMFLIAKECCRVLRVGGLFVSISFSSPEVRLKHLTRQEFTWTTEVRQIRTPHRCSARARVLLVPFSWRCR